MKGISNLNLDGKLVLLRVDLNSDVKGRRAIDGPRIKNSSQTIKELKKRKARVVVISHQGNKGKGDFLSLESHSKIINKKYAKIRFVPAVIGRLVEKEISCLKKGEAILLENLRFNDDEVKNPSRNNSLVNFFKKINFDFYVNDAFSVCHRNHTSITRFPKIFPSFAGPKLEEEFRALRKMRIRNCLYILGGGKPESNIKLLVKKNKTLSCGFFGQVVMLSRGFNFGYQNEYLKKNALVGKDFNSFLRRLKKVSLNVSTPVDFALNVRGRRKEVGLGGFPSKHRIDDIGHKTVEAFKREIRKAKAVLMKGPAGNSRLKRFSFGTVEILREISRQKGVLSVIGGGHLNDAITKYGIPKKNFSYVSLSGGALVNFIADGNLAGLKALEESKK